MKEHECPECKETSDFESWNTSTRKEYGDDIFEMGEYGGDYFCCPKCSKVIVYDCYIEGVKQ